MFGLKDGSGSVRVRKWYYGDSYRLDEVEFSDGSGWKASDGKTIEEYFAERTEAASSPEAPESSVDPDSALTASPLSAPAEASGSLVVGRNDPELEEALAVISTPSFVSELGDGSLGGWCAGPSVPADFEVARLAMDVALAGLSFETPNSGLVCDTVASGSMGMESVKLSVSTETGLEKHFEEGVRPAELPRSA